MNDRSIVKNMLNKMRAGRTVIEEETLKELGKPDYTRDNFYTRAKVLMEEAVKGDEKKKILTEAEAEKGKEHDKRFYIEKDTPQFGQVRSSQEDSIRKTVSENVKFEDKALIYYSDAEDLTLDGKIPTLNLRFQFRYNDMSGDGCYVWTEAMQLTETNARTLGKIRDAFSNWKDSITEDASLMEKLRQAAEKATKG